MFTWLNKQGVKSDLGFEVQSVDRFVIEYREKGRRISVEVEDGFGAGMKPCVIINTNAFERWDDGEIISSEDQKKIKNNFIEAMNFQGLDVRVE